MAEYKLLDPHRKAVLRLPHLAFKLWMTYWMSESDDQEAYLTLETIEEQTGMSENTIIKWRKWLVKHGWLRLCGGTAAERYSKPTPRAHQVLIYRVDDPTKNTDGYLVKESREVSRQSQEIANISEEIREVNAGTANFEVGTANVIPPKFADKVYVSVSGSGYGLPVSPTGIPASPGTDSLLPQRNEKQKPKQLPRMAPSPTVTPAIEPTTTTRSGRDKFRERYGEDKPTWFDEAAHTPWGQERRTRWCLERDSRPKTDGMQSASRTPPNSASAPIHRSNEVYFCDGCGKDELECICH